MLNTGFVTKHSLKHQVSDLIFILENYASVVSMIGYFTYINIWDNYSKPTWGLARLRFAYPWFKTYHFAHLRLLPFSLCYPPLLKRGGK